MSETVLDAALHDPEPLVRGHAAWSLGAIRSPEAQGSLSSRHAVEWDAFVISELEAAISAAQESRESANPLTETRHGRFE